MSKETGVIVLGIFVAILSFLGFPESWRIGFFVLSGFGLVVLGLLLRADHLHRESLSQSRPGAGAVPARKVADVHVLSQDESPTAQ